MRTNIWIIHLLIPGSTVTGPLTCWAAEDGYLVTKTSVVIKFKLIAGLRQRPDATLKTHVPKHIFQ